METAAKLYELNILKINQFALHYREENKQHVVRALVISRQITAGCLCLSQSHLARLFSYVLGLALLKDSLSWHLTTPLLLQFVP